MLRPIALLAAWAASAAGQQSRLDRLLADMLIFDAHIDTPRYFVDEGYRLADEHGYYELDIPRMRRGRLGAVLFGIYAQPGDYTPAQWLPRSLECLEALHAEVRRNSKDMEFAWTSGDILRIHRSGKLAAMASLEGGHLIADSLRVLRLFHTLGVRYLTLAHFKSNNFADSMTDVAAHNGLSAAGRELVAEMNRLGMIVDVSHISDKAVMDAVAASKAPVIASHSSVKSIAPIPRNMPDEVIKAIAAKGGVVCINFHAGYLHKPAYDVFARNRPRRDEEIREVLSLRANDPSRWELVRSIQRRYYREMPSVDLKKLLEHIDYVARLAGPDHVGLGSDFDGISGMVPAGMEDVSKYPSIVRGLIDLGYKDEDVRKIMGLNLVRVLKENEAVAEKLK